MDLATDSQGAMDLATEPQGAMNLATEPQGAKQLATEPQGARGLASESDRATTLTTKPQGARELPATEIQKSKQTATGRAHKHGVKEEKLEVLSHREIMHVVQDTVAGLISTDPLLKDLHPYVTLEEVNSMISLEYGQAMVVNVRRADNDTMPILVKQEATVLDLKHGIKRFIMLQLTRRGGGPIGISWRYVWKRHWLYYNGEKLSEDNRRLKDYGIRNREEVTFIKRLQER